MRERRYVEDVLDEEGWIVQGGYTAWDCDCGYEVRRYRGQGDVSCDCGREYNAFGQLLRSNWRSNRSNWDEDVSDMDGYEDSFAGEDY
jgi:hypothetical protein